MKFLLSESSWIWLDTDSDMLAWTKRESVRLTRKLCGSEPGITDPKRGIGGEPFTKAIGYLTQADSAPAKLLARPAGTGENIGRKRREIRYLLNRNLGYIRHLETLISLSECHEELFGVFEIPHTQIAPRIEALAKSKRTAESACRSAEESAGFFARAVEHPTDLAVLWMINSSMVTGTRVLERYLRNLESFYRGEEYWIELDWDALFGECPFPGYSLEQSDIDSADSADLIHYEPG